MTLDEPPDWGYWAFVVALIELLLETADVVTKIT